MIKRIFAILCVLFLLTMLVLPCFADGYYASVSAAPSVMQSILNQYASNSENVFASDGVYTGGYGGQALLAYFGSEYVTSPVDGPVTQGQFIFEYDFDFDDMEIYIFLEIEGFDVVLQTTEDCIVHVREYVGPSDEYIDICFDRGTLEMLPNNAFVDGSFLTWTDSSASPFYLHADSDYSTNYYEYWVSSDYGNTSTSYTVTGWICITNTTGANWFASYLIGDHVHYSSTSGSGASDPGNNSGSGSGTSDPGETPSTPVSEEEEAITVLSSLRDFVFSIFMAPSIFLSSILDFTILGINLYTVVKVILTLCLVAFVVALVVKLILHLR